MDSLTIEALKSEKFLEIIACYIKRFKASNGFGRWLYEYNDMDEKGLFNPTFFRNEYFRILSSRCTLDFQRKQAIWYCCRQAHDDVVNYYNDTTNFQWQINVITGEIATDDDGDELIGLEYEEAKQICEAMNEEAEEELFIVKRQDELL